MLLAFVLLLKLNFYALCCRERNCLLKEAEVLHKARFNHIIQILGICNEPEFFCIVTEFMSNGSLDLLLHEVATWGSTALRLHSSWNSNTAKASDMLLLC